MTADGLSFSDIDAFRKTLEANQAGYSITVKWFDKNLGRPASFEASAWYEIGGEPA